MKPFFFQYHSKLELFRPFSTDHLITMAIILVLCILLFVFRKKLKEKGKRKLFRFTLAFIILAANVWYHLWLVSENAWSAKKALPLQLSDLAAFLAVVMLLTKSYRIFQFMYFAGLGSAIQVIVTPDLYHFSFPHFLYFQSFVSHGGVVLACLFMIVAFNYRPTIRSMWVTILIINIYAVCVFFY
ncbi:TIGR02206 family membrane protein [Terrilactibacillus sp. S3-3]|nr:TIGR02206 family membrane protein [Terrilactibacillus sp. S3-3]